MHTLNPKLLKGPVRTLVIGCGGTGSAVAGGLAHLHNSMIALGHPGGLEVTLMDGDVVSETNVVRQPFSRSEIGLNKAVILAHRMNLFYDFAWNAIPEYFDAERDLARPDLVIICVDSRAARRDIYRALSESYNRVAYCLDIGNMAHTGQFILGQPLNSLNKELTTRLPTAAELYPEIITPSDSDQTLPSCSAIEALERQAPFLNQSLATDSLAMISRLFWFGEISYHGAFKNLQTGRSTSLPVDPGLWERIRS